MQACSNWCIVVGEISPAVRTGTLDGALCSTKTTGALVCGILQSSPKGRFTYMMSHSSDHSSEVLMCRKTCLHVGDSKESSMTLDCRDIGHEALVMEIMLFYTDVDNWP